MAPGSIESELAATNICLSVDNIDDLVDVAIGRSLVLGKRKVTGYHTAIMPIPSDYFL